MKNHKSIIVSTMQVLRWKANSQLLNGAKHLPSMNWTYGGTGFYSGLTTLTWKVLTFAKDESKRFFKFLLTLVKMLT